VAALRRAAPAVPPCCSPLTGSSSWTMGTLKAEIQENGRFSNATVARTEIFAFTDGYSNTQRIHSSLNCLTSA